MSTLADKRASNAFVATLREEPSHASLHAAFTQRTTTSNVVKVDGLASAIARAEEVIRERVKSGSRPDIFEALVAHPTDDASGPALYQPYTPTPVPPRSSTLPPPPPSASQAALTPMPLPRIAPVVVLDPKAFYHPPAPLSHGSAPARPRRSAFGAFAIAFVAPLVAVALIIGGVSYAKARDADRASLARVATPVVVETPPPVAAPLVVATPVKADEPSMLVVEVKSLKSAPTTTRKRR